MVDLGSFYRGVRAWRPFVSGRINYGVRRQRWPFGCNGWNRRFWLEAWTPIWHKGRGPYVSIGLGVVSIMRGY